VAVGLSLGVACSTGRTGGPAELVRLADVAMYDAKRAGKGRLRTAPGPSG
jgi:GGDEF domain-containing protein